MPSPQQAQYKMHKSFFDDCSRAIENNFYMEAILMEYAAIEARMEILLGVIGLPCHQYQEPNVRKSIQISHRLNCAHKLRQSSPIFEKTKLSGKFFNQLSTWTKKRDEYIHALYKNEIKYTTRLNNAKKVATDGLEYCKALYAEVNRLKRLHKNHPDLFSDAPTCQSAKCNLNNHGDE